MAGKINGENTGGVTGKIENLCFNFLQFLNNIDLSEVNTVLGDYSILFAPKSGLNPNDTILQNKLLIRGDNIQGSDTNFPTYQNMKITQGIGLEERRNNYNSAKGPVVSQVNRFENKDFLSNNPEQKIKLMRDRNHFAYIAGEGELSAPISKKTGHHPFVQHYLHFYTEDAPTPILKDMVITFSKTPPETKYNITMELKPWHLVKFFKEGVATGELWALDWSSHYNPEVHTSNLYTTWASTRGGNRQYDMFSNSIKKDPTGATISEFITGVCEMTTEVHFNAKQSRSITLEESTSADYTAQDQMSIMPARIFIDTDNTLSKVECMFPF